MRARAQGEWGFLDAEALLHIVREEVEHRLTRLAGLAQDRHTQTHTCARLNHYKRHSTCGQAHASRAFNRLSSDFAFFAQMSLKNNSASRFDRWRFRSWPAACHVADDMRATRQTTCCNAARLEIALPCRRRTVPSEEARHVVLRAEAREERHVAAVAVLHDLFPLRRFPLRLFPLKAVAAVAVLHDLSIDQQWPHRCGA